MIATAAPTPPESAVDTINSLAANMAATKQISEWLKIFVQPGQLVELRALKVPRKYGKPVTVSGYFDSEHLRDLARAAIKLTQSGVDGTGAPGVYFVFNPVRPDLLARRANRVDVSEQGSTTSDADILSRFWMLIDCDPIRPADISASEPEKEKSRQLASEVRDFLSRLGWPQPIEADSGNGTHLYYRVDLPADDGGLVKAVLNSLADRFDLPEAKIDRTVYNPARITKCPGTIARKGDPIPDRPHRTASIIGIPDRIEPVAKEQLEIIAADWRAKEVAKAKRPLPAASKNSKRHNGQSVTDRAQSYLSKVPAAVSGQGGHAATFAAAAILVKGYALSIDDAYPLLADWNQRCDPPWSEGELRHKLDDAAKSDGEPGYLIQARNGHSKSKGKRQQPDLPEDAAEDSLLIPENQTDVSLSGRFARMFGEDLKYVPEWKTWIVWTGLQWRVDNTSQEVEFAKTFSEYIWREADRHEPDDSGPDGEKQENPLAHLAKRVSTRKFVFDLLSLAKSEKDFVLSSDSLDMSRTLLNVLNGTIDLRTGELHPHRKDDFITKICPMKFDPSATYNQWEDFVHKVLGKDTDLANFLQTWFGYCLTGETKEQSLAVLYGEGGNGKSVLVNTLLAVFGKDYGSQASSSLLVERNREEHPTILAGLFGRRLVLCTETGEGARFNEALVKTLTGQDTIAARKMYQDFWEFIPSHKLVLLTNHKPEVRGTDIGIWRRIILVPFLQYFWDAADGETGEADFKKDKDLKDKLEAESAGILNWLITGARHWYANGLDVPEAARSATEEYRKSENVIQRFIDDVCEESIISKVKASSLYKAYQKWCIENGEYVQKQKKFGDLITARKYEKQRCDGNWYIGIGIKDEIR